MSRISILGVSVDALTHAEAIGKIRQFAERDKPSLVCTPNTEIITLAQSNKELKDILNRGSALNLADGFGLLWAARYQTLKHPVPEALRKPVLLLQWFLTLILIPVLPGYFRHPISERIAGADFIWDIAKVAADKKLKIFLLGGGPTVAEQCALILQTEIPGLRIAGISANSPDQTALTIESVRKSKADVLMVAYGAPKQEYWLSQNLSKTGCKIGIGIGGAFDFIAGTKKRAPLWMRRSGAEWLYRLAIEPSRIWRQLALPYFSVLILIDKLKKS